MTTQKQRILELLKDGDWHSNGEIVFSLRILRASARVYDLRADGYTIEAKAGKDGAYFYRLKSEPKQLVLA